MSSRYPHPIRSDFLGAILIVAFFSLITWAAISLTTHPLTVRVSGRAHYTATRTTYWRCRKYPAGQICITRGVHWY